MKSKPSKITKPKVPPSGVGGVPPADIHGAIASEEPALRLIHHRLPQEGEFFDFTTANGKGTIEFEARVNDQIIWSDLCPDPPCHEGFKLPDGIAGSILHVIANAGEAELVFFIQDDGTGIPMKRRGGGFVPASDEAAPASAPAATANVKEEARELCAAGA